MDSEPAAVLDPGLLVFAEREHVVVDVPMQSFVGEHLVLVDHPLPQN